MTTKVHQRFGDFLRKAFGRYDTVLRHACPMGGPDVQVLVYRDFPEPGMITGVTWGLSAVPRPGEPTGSGERSELVISLESDDTLWAWNAAYFAAEYRGQRGFVPGEVYFADEPLARDTAMDGLLVNQTTILPPADAWVDMPGHRIRLLQLYPIHRSELVVYERYGLSTLWNHKGFDIYHPGRAPVVID